MHKVIWATETGESFYRNFESMDNAVSYQEYLCFVCGFEAEIES